MSGWMKDIRGNIRLSHLRIPGSHDAGLYAQWNKKGVLKKEADWNSAVITQTQPISGQLEDGFRFFDLRIYKNKSGNLHAGHFAEAFGRKGSSDFGGWGPSLDTILLDVKTFLETDGYKEEIVILKFSHIKSSNTKDVRRAVQAMFGRERIYKRNKIRALGAETLSSLRGKVIAIYDKKFHKISEKHARAVIFKSLKGDDILSKVEKDTGIWVLRGEYSGKRQLLKIEEKQNKNLRNWKKNQRKAEYSEDFMQLYWTSTFSTKQGILHYKNNIRKNSAPLWETTGINKLKRLMKKEEPQIVMADFCDVDKFNIIRSGLKGCTYSY